MILWRLSVRATALLPSASARCACAGQEATAGYFSGPSARGDRGLASEYFLRFRHATWHEPSGIEEGSREPAAPRNWADVAPGVASTLSWHAPRVVFVIALARTVSWMAGVYFPGVGSVSEAFRKRFARALVAVAGGLGPHGAVLLPGTVALYGDASGCVRLLLRDIDAFDAPRSGGLGGDSE